MQAGADALATVAATAKAAAASSSAGARATPARTTPKTKTSSERASAKAARASPGSAAANGSAAASGSAAPSSDAASGGSAPSFSGGAFRQPPKKPTLTSWRFVGGEERWLVTSHSEEEVEPGGSAHDEKVVTRRELEQMIREENLPTCARDMEAKWESSHDIQGSIAGTGTDEGVRWQEMLQKARTKPRGLAACVRLLLLLETHLALEEMKGGGWSTKRATWCKQVCAAAPLTPSTLRLSTPLPLAAPPSSHLRVPPLTSLLSPPSSGLPPLTSNSLLSLPRPRPSLAPSAPRDGPRRDNRRQSLQRQARWTQSHRPHPQLL